jgi:hypothetical protein
VVTDGAVCRNPGVDRRVLDLESLVDGRSHRMGETMSETP